MNRDPMEGTQHCGGDAAAYVLGALDPEEVEAFHRHLTECAICRDEVASLQHTVDALPMAAPQLQMPRGLRRRVMSEVSADARRSRRRQGGSVTAPRLERRWIPSRPALAVGTLAALALAAFGGVELSSSGSTQARVISASVGVAQLRVGGGHAELVVHRLPQPATGRIYEVWLQRGHAAPSPTRALFSVTKAGDGTVDVPGDLHGVTAVMVTQEPAGGSLAPTSAPVIVAKLT
jgi:anti-sigma factor RsiW